MAKQPPPAAFAGLPAGLPLGRGVTCPGPEHAFVGTSLQSFRQLAASAPGVRLVPVWRRIFSDALTPVLAYRCLVAADDIRTPSFLLESVSTSGTVGRYSFVGARPCVEVSATANAELKAAVTPHLPGAGQTFAGGWVGYGGYDTVRYTESKKLPFESAPTDDRHFADLHFGLYRDVIVFDHVGKMAYVVHWADVTEFGGDVDAAHSAALGSLAELAGVVSRATPLSPLTPGAVDLDVDAPASRAVNPSNMTKPEFLEGVRRCKEHIVEGDAFQIVLSQRFERRSASDPFSVYRALRIINPSPYMIYMQSDDVVLVASSPEILCRVVDRTLTNRPLAGTRRRGKDAAEDEALAAELLADEKDRAEHVMLVDLGRNDVGRVAAYGTVKPLRLMEVERFSHVMHLSSTVVGELRPEFSSWDALRSTLPAGTVSGAPKVRAMQIIDDLEPTRRGPYGGGVGWISFHDDMNIALALRTMVLPAQPVADPDSGVPHWVYYLQAGAGIVADSDPDAEFVETVNKAMALGRAIDLAEEAF
ncbi:hypothetical protein I4F81_001130 [Pyropia yezoensis]|uniref:Uncharacterized protein n=1 Tax=Pyropia yezoensis TaxID=2788 RepID=A0ACC3BKN8_PYRYE|nr:hypothetical protein I4F81_001130 [Neopyropia yezoensis]